MKQYKDYELINELRRRGNAVVTWNIIDVFDRAENLEVEITEEQAKQVIINIDRLHDANYGITWDTIDYHIEEILIGEQ